MCALPLLLLLAVREYQVRTLRKNAVVCRSFSQFIACAYLCAVFAVKHRAADTARNTWSAMLNGKFVFCELVDEFLALCRTLRCISRSQESVTCTLQKNQIEWGVETFFISHAMEKRSI